MKLAKILCPFFLIVFLVSNQLLHSASQNKLIAKPFHWKISQSEHFDIYHDQDSKELVNASAEILEKAYTRITKSLGMTIPKRSSFFLYLNHNEFEQNNITRVGEGTGGVTEAFKDRFIVFNNGSLTWLEHVIEHEFVHVCQFQILYAGFWKSARLLKSPLYPLWFMEGMAEYYSSGKSGELNILEVRDAITSDTFIPLRLLHGFNHVKPRQVTLAYNTGNEAIQFIANEYGKDKVGLLLKTIPEKFDINTTLQDTLGLSIVQLEEKLQEDLEEKYFEKIRGRNEPTFYGLSLTDYNHIYPVFNEAPAISANGESLFYISGKDGFNEIYRYDFELKRSLSLHLQDRFSSKVENIHRDGSALSISPDGHTLLFAGERKQIDHLYLYDLRRDRLKIVTPHLDGVKSPQFSSDGEKIVFIGMKQGLNDIYTCDLQGRDLNRLTQTLEDENDVRFFPNRGTILFSREGSTDGTLKELKKNLWTLDLESETEEQITEGPGLAMQPAIHQNGQEILFVRSKKGFSEINWMKLDEEPQPLTKSIGGSFSPVFLPKEDKFAFVGFRKGQKQIYQSSYTIQEMIQKNQNAEETTISTLEEDELKTSETDELQLAEDLSQKTTAAVESEIILDQLASSSSLISSKPKKYRFRASTDFFFPVFFYSSQDGLFLSTFWQASEMLGNHQMQAGVTYASALDFLNYQIRYSYLRFRPQLFIGAQGDTQNNVLATTRDRRREEAQFVGITYPLNRFDSLTARFLTTQRKVQLTDDNFILFRPVSRENVVGLSFLRDISQGRYLETTSGYRIGIQGEETNETFGSSLEYRNIFLDYNQFIPAPSEGTLAFRLFSGASFGSNKQLFRTGGSDLLRGYGRFDFNSAASRFAVTNLEYRFPIVLNANSHIGFLFPDFLFKNVYGHVFMDTGVLWRDGPDLARHQLSDVRHSLGIGLRVQAFVLQTFPISLQLDFARRTLDGEQTVYFGFGPKF